MSQDIDVVYVAELARIALAPEEVGRLQGELESIVGYVRKIGELRDVPADPLLPLLHGGAAPVNAFREDAPAPSGLCGPLLANAPERNGPEFRLPKIVEDA